jgi:hypothetical protein
MTVGDDRALGPAIGVDMKTPRAAIETFAVHCEPSVEAMRLHFLGGCVEQITEKALVCYFR